MRDWTKRAGTWLAALSVAACSGGATPKIEEDAAGAVVAQDGAIADAPETPTTDAAPGAAPDASPMLAAERLGAAELERVVTYLASDALEGRDEGTPGGALARQFIVAELTACGVAPAGTSGFEQPISVGRGTNILGRIEGTDPALRARTVVVSAHYDHVGVCGGEICNGANDNAAGVAIALGVACAIAASPLPRSVLFAAWDAEEPPTFLTSSMGSEFFAATAGNTLANIDVAIALDLVGGPLWPGFAKHIILGAESSAAVASVLDGITPPAGLEVLRAGLHLVEETPLGHQPWSDYDAFRNRGVPFLFFSNGQNKDYHEVSDEAGTLDYALIEREGALLLQIVQGLGRATTTPTFDAAGSNAAQDARTVEGVLEAALAPGGIVDALSLAASTRTALTADLDRVRPIRARLDSGGAASGEDIRVLRSGTQRIMCLAGTSFPEAVCGFL